MHPDKSCDGCTLCCTLVSVVELAKPACRLCDHAEPGRGCGVYEARPFSCQLYQCVWLRAPPRLMGEALRPDKCHVLLEETHQGLMARCDPAWPDAWRTEPVASLLKLHAERGNPVYVMCGRQMYVIGIKGAFAVPRDWVRDADDGMRQHFQIPTEILQQVGWGPLRWLQPRSLQ